MAFLENDNDEVVSDTVKPSVVSLFSKKLTDIALKPSYRGAYSIEDGTDKSMAFVEAKYKDTKLYWLVDVQNDTIYSSKFFAYGGKVSVAFGDTLCGMVNGLTVEEACEIVGSDVELQLRDDPSIPAMPNYKDAILVNTHELLDLMDEAYDKAKAIVLASDFVSDSDKKIPTTSLAEADKVWFSLSEEDQIKQINVILDERVRPALLSDGGNVEVLTVTNSEKVLVHYEGACGNCASSTGATLSMMEQALRQGTYNGLVVIPSL